MPRLYDPDVKTEYAFSDSTHYEAVMLECRNGNWVKFSTYKDETRRLRSEIERLKSQLRKSETSDQ